MRYRVACEGVSLLRELFAPLGIDEPLVEDTWVSFSFNPTVSCMVVPAGSDDDVLFAFSQQKRENFLNFFRSKRSDNSLDEQLIADLRAAFDVSKLLVGQEWMKLIFLKRRRWYSRVRLRFSLI